MGFLSKWREERRRARAEIRRIRGELERRGVARRDAERLAKLVYRGEYTLDEAVDLYKQYKGRRIRVEARRMASRPRRSSVLSEVDRVSSELLRGFTGLGMWGGRHGRAKKKRKKEGRSESLWQWW